MRAAFSSWSRSRRACTSCLAFIALEGRQDETIENRASLQAVLELLMIGSFHVETFHGR